jgi:hypothetical protein
MLLPLSIISYQSTAIKYAAEDGPSSRVSSHGAV